jgi:hypothetical protein
VTFARFATVAVPLPPREPGPPPARLGAVTGRETAHMPLYRADDRPTALLPVCDDDVEEARR